MRPSRFAPSRFKKFSHDFLMKLPVGYKPPRKFNGWLLTANTTCGELYKTSFYGRVNTEFHSCEGKAI